MKEVDVSGMRCPMPLIETKKALKSTAKEEAIKIIIDNETSLKNVLHYLKDNQIEVEKNTNGKKFELILFRSGEEAKIEQAEDYCGIPVEKEDSFVVLFGKDRFGEGSDELGVALVGGFFATMVESGNTPSKVIFLNSGINLVSEESPVLNNIKTLEKRGAEILSCGTCLDYYGKIDQLKAGRVTNMLEILEVLKRNTKVINV